MEKARSENEKLDLEFSVSGVSTQNYLSFIQILDAIYISMISSCVMTRLE